jgi:hypothetical protein
MFGVWSHSKIHYMTFRYSSAKIYEKELHAIWDRTHNNSTHVRLSLWSNVSQVSPGVIKYCWNYKGRVSLPFLSRWGSTIAVSPASINNIAKSSTWIVLEDGFLTQSCPPCLLECIDSQCFGSATPSSKTTIQAYWCRVWLGQLYRYVGAKKTFNMTHLYW